MKSRLESPEARPSALPYPKAAGRGSLLVPQTPTRPFPEQPMARKQLEGSPEAE